MRFIDAVHDAVWLPPAHLTHEEREASWINFKAEVNSNNGLEWEFSERQLLATFLDLTIEIKDNGRHVPPYTKKQWHFTIHSSTFSTPSRRVDEPC